MRTLTLATLIAAAVALASARPSLARADQVAPGPHPADVLLDEGTRLFTEEADYDTALLRFQESYRQRPGWKALNGMALVYQQQGKYVEAIDAYERLLAEFGATLTDGQMTTVRRRLGELEKRVGVVVVKIAQDGAHVAIDGREIGRGPAEVRVRLLPGPHTLVATLDGHQTLTRRLEVEAAKPLPLAVQLEIEKVKVVVEQQAVRYERPYPTWVPWTTVGGGVALALVGGALHYSAAQDFDEFDALVEAAVSSGHEAATVDQSARESGELKQIAAISLYAVGGAAIATGVVLLFFNRPQPVEPGPRARVMFGGTSVGVAVDF